MNNESQILNKNAVQQSMISVYLHALIYYDELYSFFFLFLQFFIFVYKYNILDYKSNVIAGEVIILGLLIIANFPRIAFARIGNKGKKYGYLFGSILFDILLLVGFIYIVALQTNALYLEMTTAIIGLLFVGLAIVLTIVMMIVYRVKEIE